jgi:hypothetical protein
MEMVIRTGSSWSRTCWSKTIRIKIKTKAFELENALFARGQELPINGKAGGERQEMRDASRKLLQVKIEKLGFPIDPKFLGGSDRSVDPQ